MKIRTVCSLMAVFLFVLPVVHADPADKGVSVEKTYTFSGDEVCPGDILDVRVRLTGVGEATLERDPLNVVVVIDKSGSMGFDGFKGWNPALEPPYGFGPGYPATPTPTGDPYVPWPPGNSPYVETIWAAWKFYDYLIEHGPTTGEDFGALVFYGSNNFPNGVPGFFPVRTPTPISRHPDPEDSAHKNFWWHSHLALEPVAGATAMGPGMQIARDILGAMKTQNPGSRNVMVMMSDGFPNQWWTPLPGENPSNWPGTGSDVVLGSRHAREIARRTTLSEPLNQGGTRVYPQVWDSTIYTIGLGQGVNHALMAELADPWAPLYWGGVPRPASAHQGFYEYAETGQDIEEAFAQIARAIVSEVAGEDIAVTEVMPQFLFGNECPCGTVLITQVVPGSFNPAPIVIPPVNIWEAYQYIWEFDEIFIDQIIDITFQVRILEEHEFPPGAGDGPYHIECPGSNIAYREPDSLHIQQEFIEDPMFEFGECYVPPTPTPTCVPGVVFFDDFETGDFSLWDAAGPESGVRIYQSATYANSGDYFVLFGGCEFDDKGSKNYTCDEESVMYLFLDFSDPVRQGPVLEVYLRPMNLLYPTKSNPPQASGWYDKFIVDVMDEFGTRVSEEFNFFNYGGFNKDYVHVRMCLKQFAGSEHVRVRFLSYFPFTIPNPQPWSLEPMVFVDDVFVYDYCYDPTPTPTPAPDPPVPIPATGRGGIALTLLIIGLLILAPVLRRVF